MASRINMLSKETFSKIAAGEVVEKPSSVVKELVENSIDAGSKNITVEIVNAGLDLIKIVDDGHGIYNDDLEKAFMPHATSKIRDINDIFNINTLGFRGEALASVASVSKILLKSKTKDEDAMEVYIEGGDLKYKKYTNQNQGTLIEVKELFFNVPARFKFLKSTTKETSNIGDVMSKLALSHPEIAFTYINNDKVILKTYGNNNQRDVIRTVYNKKIYENVNYFDKEIDGVRVYGYIGNEEISRGSRSQQTIFINSRHINSRTITAAVERAYQSFITISKFPFFVLSIDLDPTKVDVNVHPQKAEVKFEDDKFIFSTVFDSIHKTLREVYKDNLGFLNENDERSIEDKYKSGILNKESLKENETTQNISQGVFNFDQNSKINTGNSFSNSEVLKSTPSETYVREVNLISENEVDIPIDLKNNFTVSNEEINSENIFKEEQNKNIFTNDKNKVNNDSEMLYNNLLDAPKFPEMEIIGQYSKTYILAQYNQTLYLFDQHACHEKINFENYMEEFKNHSIVVQPLLVPELADLSMEDWNLYLENKELFTQAGFSIEEFGDRTVSIREVPAFLGRSNPKTYFNEILDNLKNLGKGTKEEVRFMKIATAACKASIKANDKLTFDEMKSLLDRLRYIKEPFTCPHGRPTMIKFELKDIEKMFRRII